MLETSPSDTPAQAATGGDPPQTTVIRATGLAYFPIAFLARFPFAMMVVGTLTLVVAARESVALGGINSALVGLGGAIGGPMLGAAADRFGQRPVLLAAGAANGTMMILLAAVAYSSAPDTALLAVGFFTGATTPQAGPLSRSRLIQLIALRLPRERRVTASQSTMAYESAADEVTFVFGPVLVGALATALGAAAAMIGAAAVTFVFVTAFALHRTATVDKPHLRDGPADRGPLRAVFSGRILLLVAGALSMGMLFGSLLTSLIAFMGDRGDSDAAGLVYGVLGVGSAILALSCALLPAWISQRVRWIFFASLALIGAVVYSLSSTLPSVAVGIGLAGLGAGPTIVTLYNLAADAAPKGRYSTVMTMIGPSITVGQAISAAVTGQIAERVSTAAAMWAPTVAAALVLTVGLVAATVFRPTHVPVHVPAPPRT